MPTVRRYVTLEPGQHFALPSNGSLVSVIETAGGSAYSECSIPPATPRSCWRFKWEDDGDDASTRNIVQSLIIDGIEYAFLTTGYADTYMTSSHFVKDVLASDPVLKHIVQGFCDASAEGKHEIIIAVPQGSKAPELKILDRMSTGDFNVYVKGLADSGCAECNNFISS